MITRIHTVAFQGIETLPVEVQVHLGAGLPAFTIVGLPDKAIAESRERVRAVEEHITQVMARLNAASERLTAAH